MRPEDEAEFTGLVERQWRFAYRVAWAVLRNGADAEDAAQEVFLKIFRARAWQGLQDERAFVARAAWRLAVGAHAASRQRLKRGGDEPVEDAPDVGLSPEETVAAANWEAAVASVHRSRSYVETVSTQYDHPQQIRTGARIPVVNGSSWQYMDVGVDFDVFSPKENGDKLAFNLTADVVIPIGKATVVYSADDLDSKGKMQVE
ncbi:MAG: sigma factor, partial [Acidobacteriaceae bacterium]